MSNSNLAGIKVWANGNNYTAGRQGARIQEITIHHMAGVLTSRACGSIFQNPKYQASSHYGIGYNGDIAQYVDEGNIAWTNGNWEANKRAVTIEVSNIEMGGSWKVSDASLESLINLVLDIARRNNLLPLIKGKTLTWHQMYYNTNCPGAYLLSKLDYIISEVNKRANIKPKSVPKVKVNKSINELANEVIAGKWGNGEDRKRRLQSAGYNYNLVQDAVNAKYNISTPKKSISTLADEVMAGKWGNGDNRRIRLQNAGYNYNLVQKEVNKRYGIY